ncbi:MAG: MerR family transcriptional regulator [Oscillospiraceae bacterium]|jgi:DNA-binding transcriptional MerR regulator|nr:MerR family transcriptional regulator [Oscillospiraceae bacterium]
MNSQLKNQELMSIKTFSEFTMIPQSALRYYDTAGLFSPAIRGENNYRYYSPQQIITLNQVITLSELKVPLKKIGYMAKNRTPRSTMQLLEKQEDFLETELNRVSERLSVVHTLQNLLQLSLNVDENAIEQIQSDTVSITFAPDNVFGNCPCFYSAFRDACAWFRRSGVNLCYPIGGWWASFREFLAEPSRPDKFFSLDPRGRDEKPAGDYLIAYTRGFYGEMGNLPDRLLTNIASGEPKKPGPVYVIYVQDEVSVPNPNNYLSQATVALA